MLPSPSQLTSPRHFWQVVFIFAGLAVFTMIASLFFVALAPVLNWCARSLLSPTATYGNLPLLAVSFDVGHL